ncbi:putative MFS transporter [Scopulibacillus darangshiensis]|uniref:Putative MFS transporter n=1 Tax=Scopulibacillus darangshiensis TaxID=442528 RepID=A0A4R2NIJ6_9BACL|nr:MFS transporter [Scopulibacillus darangshiensis]TCP21303.1 putative MFS transporter [Scopulibacillus darangshiensis]
MTGTIKIDNAPLNKFHLKITAFTFGSNFSDGYALGIIGMALTLIGPQMELGTVWQGLIGSSALIGLFVGSLLLGWLGDRIGRQKVYLLDFLLIAVASFLQFFVDGPLALFILRLLIGFGIGADYAIGPTLLSEFVPKKYRGSLLASLTVMWTVGYVVAYFVGILLEKAGPDSWRWMLASGAIPAVIVLLLRIGTPESPRWLISKGRIEEARQIVKRFIGPNVDISDLIADGQSEQHSTSFMMLFKKKHRTRTAFGCLFYFCQVLPYFAIYTFLPLIFKAMGVKDDILGNILLNIFLLIGAILSLWFINKLSRRTFTIGSFLTLTVSLLLLGIWPHGPFILVMLFFAVFTLVMSGFSNIAQVYPAELFPTEIRGSGVGLTNGVSRIGSAIGTFLLPISLASLGLGPSMIGLAVVLLIGAVISIAWAPETKDLSLDEASQTPESSSQDVVSSSPRKKMSSH